MLTLTLPVIFRPGKEGEEDCIVERTFTEDDADFVLAPFKGAITEQLEKEGAKHTCLNT